MLNTITARVSRSVMRSFLDVRYLGEKYSKHKANIMSDREMDASGTYKTALICGNVI